MIIDFEETGRCPECGGESTGRVFYSFPKQTSCEDCGAFWSFGDSGIRVLSEEEGRRLRPGLYEDLDGRRSEFLGVLLRRVRSRVRQKVLVKGQKWRHKETGEELLIDHWINFPGNFVCLKREGASRFHLAIQPEDLLREYEWVSEPPRGDSLLDIRKKIIANYLANQSRHRFSYDYPRPAPLRTRRDYHPVGRKTFLIEQLPDWEPGETGDQGRSSGEDQSLEQKNKEDSGR